LKRKTNLASKVVENPWGIKFGFWWMNRDALKEPGFSGLSTDNPPQFEFLSG